MNYPRIGSKTFNQDLIAHYKAFEEKGSRIPLPQRIKDMVCDPTQISPFTKDDFYNSRHPFEYIDAYDNLLKYNSKVRHYPFQENVTDGENMIEFLLYNDTIKYFQEKKISKLILETQEIKEKIAIVLNLYPTKTKRLGSKVGNVLQTIIKMEKRKILKNKELLKFIEDPSKAISPILNLEKFFETLD